MQKKQRIISKIIRSVRIIVITLIFVMGITACTSEKKADENAVTNPSSDMKAVEKFFPSLEGAVETQWEQITLGEGNERTPGPTDYQYQGYIILSEDSAQKYESAYEWNQAEPDVEFESIEEREGNWKYSGDFRKDIIPEYYGGSVWKDGNTILFSITTT